MILAQPENLESELIPHVELHRRLHSDFTTVVATLADRGADFEAILDDVLTLKLLAARLDVLLEDA